jgi:hypothetical protein
VFSALLFSVVGNNAEKCYIFSYRVFSALLPTTQNQAELIAKPLNSELKKK